MARQFYRIIDHELLTGQDFRSDQDRGLPAAPWETPRHRQGISVWDTQSRARNLGKWLKRKRGQQQLYLVAISFEDDGSLTAERSGPSPGHHTLWGSPSEILARSLVVGVV